MYIVALLKEVCCPFKGSDSVGVVVVVVVDYADGLVSSLIAPIVCVGGDRRSVLVV